MGVAAILIMWPGPFEQPSLGVFMWNLSSISPVVSEKKMFENVDRRMIDRRTPESAVY